MTSEAFPKLVLVPSGKGEIVLEPQSLSSEGRNEAWLRDFLLRHPGTLPAADIDPAFSDPLPVCRELRTSAGPIDAVFINSRGALTLVECKLWRNPEARREVVAQILDYAKEIARWRYEDLQREVSRARGEPGVNSLFEIARTREPGLREATFVDAVSRSLAAGRFLLLVAGDGIREGTEAIVQFMARHAGLHFTFGLVEMAGYPLPEGGLLVQPRLLARTVNIERAVIRVEGAASADAVILDPEESDASAALDAVAAERRGFDPMVLEADRAFWPEFKKRLRLDDPAQPPPVTGFGRARLDIIRGVAWVNAYNSRRSNTLGAGCVLKGDSGRAIFEALAGERVTIDAELLSAEPSEPIYWGESGVGKSIYVTRSLRGDWTPAVEEAALSWLLKATNVLVNVFRPRVLRLAGTVSR